MVHRLGWLDMPTEVPDGLDPGGGRPAGQRLDRSIAFYRDQVGFDLDHDTTNEYMHVAQLTPRGSGCSIVLGDLPAHREMVPGSMRGLQLWSPTAPPPARS